MVKRAKQTGHHLVDMDLAKNAEDSERVTTITDNRRDFLLVGKLGRPDFSQQPLAASVISFAEMGQDVQETYTARPHGKAKAQQFVMAHSGLVTPMHTLLNQTGHPGSWAANLEKPNLRWMILMANEEVLAGHLLFPDVAVTDENRRVASALFVSRALTTNRSKVIGDVQVGGNWEELAFDLAELTAREGWGITTELRRPESIHSRALGAVGHLVELGTLQEAVDLYEEPPETTVIQAGTMLHEE